MEETEFLLSFQIEKLGLTNVEVATSDQMKSMAQATPSACPVCLNLILPYPSPLCSLTCQSPPSFFCLQSMLFIASPASFYWCSKKDSSTSSVQDVHHCIPSRPQFLVCRTGPGGWGWAGSGQKEEQLLATVMECGVAKWKQKACLERECCKWKCSQSAKEPEESGAVGPVTRKWLW